MVNPAPGPETGDGPVAGPNRSTSGAPRWVKVFGIVTGVLALLLLILMLVTGGNHGPGRHLSSGTLLAPAAVAGAATGSLGAQ